MARVVDEVKAGTAVGVGHVSDDDEIFGCLVGVVPGGVYVALAVAVVPVRRHVAAAVSERRHTGAALLSVGPSACWRPSSAPPIPSSVTGGPRAHRESPRRIQAAGASIG